MAREGWGVKAVGGSSRAREAAGGTTKQASCDCGKTIREQSDQELVNAVQKHAKEAHGMDLTREQVLAMAEPV